MQAVTTIGLDIAKSVFQIHGINAQGNIVVRRQISCLIGAVAVALGAVCFPSRRSCASRPQPAIFLIRHELGLPFRVQFGYRAQA